MTPVLERSEDGLLISALATETEFSKREASQCLLAWVGSNIAALVAGRLEAGAPSLPPTRCLGIRTEQRLLPVQRGDVLRRHRRRRYDPGLSARGWLARWWEPGAWPRPGWSSLGWRSWLNPGVRFACQGVVQPGLLRCCRYADDCDHRLSSRPGAGTA